jgi:hypothetical protein
VEGQMQPQLELLVKAYPEEQVQKEHNQYGIQAVDMGAFYFLLKLSQRNGGRGNLTSVI